MREENRKLTFILGENETEIDHVLVRKHLLFLWNVKAFPGEFHHAFVVTDIGEKKLRKVVRKTGIKVLGEER